MVRVPPEVHRNLAIQALESGVTLSVIGRNAVGNRQSESSSATYTWTVEAVNLTDAIFALGNRGAGNKVTDLPPHQENNYQHTKDF